MRSGVWCEENLKFVVSYYQVCRSQWPRRLRRRSAAARLLGSWVRIPWGAWMFVCCECCVLSGGGLCDELITRPEESYRLCCVVVCDLETSRMGAPYIYDISRLRVNSYYLGFIIEYSSFLATSTNHAIPRYPVSSIPLCLPLSCILVFSPIVVMTLDLR